MNISLGTSNDECDMLDTSLEESHWERDTQDTIALQTQNLTCLGGTLLGRATTMGFPS